MTKREKYKYFFERYWAYYTSGWWNFKRFVLRLSLLNRRFKKYLVCLIALLVLCNNAYAREINTTGKDMIFIPQPLIKKSVFEKIGMFNKNIKKYAADADLKKRLEKNKIKWVNFPSAKFYHQPISMKEDLSSAFKYGIGRADRRKYEGKGFPNFLKESLSYFSRGLSEKGFITAVYLYFWYLSFYSGFVRGYLKNE